MMIQALIDKGFDPEVAEKLLANFKAKCDRTGREYTAELTRLLTRKKRSVIVNDAFAWDDSTEGHVYWRGLYSKLEEEEATASMEVEILQEIKRFNLTPEDLELVMAEVPKTGGTLDRLEGQTSKTNMLLAAFDWSRSQKGEAFWVAKFKEFEAQEANEAKEDDDD